MPSDTELVMTRSFDAPRALVYEVWTNPKHVPKWMSGPDGWRMTVCEADLRPGGLSRFVWENADGQSMEMTGEYLEVVPPERFVSIKSMGAESPSMTNTIVFTEEAGRTTVTITMRYPTKEARDAALQTGMDEGMEIGFRRLDALLASLA
jgi:uncharacterized protein YndB with AHSA1/START domain